MARPAGVGLGPSLPFAAGSPLPASGKAPSPGSAGAPAGGSAGEPGGGSAGGSGNGAGGGGGAGSGGSGLGGGWRSLRAVALHETARQRYLGYALSVITSRAIPDVRDGLKPVQRRILYAMFRDLKLLSKAKPRKSAAVVGEVMGRYHPHGDTAIYDAMVRMAQGFNLRYPLVDGHGNFGSVDGDPAAAMRYTEVRLQPLADELLEELVGQTVAWRPNYDGTRDEPVVLPSRLPNLLINGASGIAVGLATNIPPHNLREVVNATLALLADPTLSVSELTRHVPGPDFPTGGQILNGTDELRQIYETGKGPVRLRGTWTEEKIDRKDCVVISSIPYQQNKAALVAKIGELILDRKVPQLLDVRDESTSDVRVVLELKKGADAEQAMAYLCKHTPLEQSFHVNLTCLVPTDNPSVGAPERLDLKQVLQHFIDFRLYVIRGRLQHELDGLLRRIHVLEGFEKIFLDIEEAVRIVLRSKDRADASLGLQRRFGLDEEQAEAVLETKLYRLARLEIETVQAELAEKRAAAAKIQALLADEGALRGILGDELRAVANRYGDVRRTAIGGARELRFDPQAYVVREESWVIVTRDGWVKRQASFTDLSAIRLREGAEIGWIFRTHTLATVTFFTSLGKAYTLRVDQIKATAGYGQPVQVYFEFADKETLVSMVCHDPRCLPPEAEEEPKGSGATQGVELLRRSPTATEVLPLQVRASTPPAEDDGPDDEPELADGEPGDDAGVDDGEGSEGLGDEGDEGEEGGEGGEGGELPIRGPLLVAVTRAGRGLRFPLSAYAEPSLRNGRRFARLSAGEAEDAVIGVHLLYGGELVSLATRNGHVLLFPAAELKLLRSAGRGVTAIRLVKGDRVLAFGLARGRDEGVRVTTSRGKELVVSARAYRIASRGGKGTEVIKRGGLDKWQQPALEIVGLEQGEELGGRARTTPMPGGAVPTEEVEGVEEVDSLRLPIDEDDEGED